MTAPTFLSLFAGIGGLDLGLERAGWSCVSQVELDKFCRRVLAQHWPDVPRHDDVRTFRADRPADLVCGGFPCQDVSVAGRRAGLAGARTGLFWESLRIARESHAKWILLENVPGLLTSHRGADFATVLGALVDAGFPHVEWRVLDSQFFGVPQRRRRVFIVAGARDPLRAPVLAEPEGGGGDSGPGDPARTQPAAGLDGGVEGGVVGALEAAQGGADDNDAQAGRLIVVGAPAHPDGMRAAARVPGRMDGAAYALYPVGGSGGDTARAVEVLPALTTETGNGRGTLVHYRKSRRVGDIRTTELVLGTTCAWCPTDPRPDSPRYRTLGNAVTVPVAEHVGRLLLAAHRDLYEQVSCGSLPTSPPPHRKGETACPACRDADRRYRRELRAARRRKASA